MPKPTHRSAQGGLTARITLFSLEHYTGTLDAKAARLWFRGQVVNEETKERVMFNDAGELLTSFGRWNSKRFQELRKAKAVAV